MLQTIRVLVLIYHHELDLLPHPFAGIGITQQIPRSQLQSGKIHGRSVAPQPQVRLIQHLARPNNSLHSRHHHVGVNEIRSLLPHLLGDFIELLRGHYAPHRLRCGMDLQELLDEFGRIPIQCAKQAHIGTARGKRVHYVVPLFSQAILGFLCTPSNLLRANPGKLLHRPARCAHFPIDIRNSLRHPRHPEIRDEPGHVFIALADQRIDGLHSRLVYEARGIERI